MRALLRCVVAALALGAVSSCGEAPTAPSATRAFTPSLALGDGTGPAVVISQVYGGGGNSGATFRNDFIELHNPGPTAVSVAGWSVQYASAAGTTWQVTALTGTIPAGGYYLVRQAAGTGGTVDLPTPDAIGTLAMSGTAGKVALANTTAALTAACPTSTTLVNAVSYGAATDCGAGTTAATSNTTAVIRNAGGCAFSGVLSADFTAAVPTPRNTASPALICTAPAAPVTVTLAPATSALTTGATQLFVATARDASDNVVGTTYTWLSSNTAAATVDGAGLVTAIAAGTATITATSANAISATATVTVTDPIPTGPAADIVISQIYGGGGNSGAPFTNDYVELFNRGTTPVNLTGWRVSYSSAAGTTWASTELTGTIQPNGYFLVQQAAGAAVAAALPTADAVGTLAMGATAGKIVLSSPGTLLTSPCPAGAGIVDRVGYGGNSTDNGCATAWGGRTGDLSNTSAAFRRNDGCINTGSASSDFTVLSPIPHNSASPAKNCTQPPRVQSTASLVIHELMGDPASAESASWGQWFEVHNTGTTAIDLRGWTIVSDGTSQPNHVITSSVVVPAGGYAVLGRGGDINRNGGVVIDYNYFTGGSTTIWLDQRDFLMLVDTLGARVDSVAWTSLPRGVTKGVRDASQPRADADDANWGYATTRFGDGDYGTPGAANTALATTPPFVSANRIVFSGRVATDAPLPVGFEAQVFATELDATNTPVPTTFTWTALTPAIATIDAFGVVRANAAGTARFRALAADGAIGVHTLTMVTPVASTTAQYLNNTEFGDATDADPSDDYIVRRPQYTTSFNVNRGIPNWVAYNLNGTAIQSGQDRCNCFTYDPELPASFPRYTTADYTGAGTFAGYGIDRGHLARSFDRTTGTLDNATTYYFSNIIPQAADQNQGPWAQLENYLGDLAQTQGRELYIYTGPAGTKGTVKGEGKITIPAFTWKVALVLNRGQTIADVRDYRDVQEVVAVVMPNEPGVRNVDWRTAYRVTVDSVERLSGYRFLSALPTRTQRALKSGTLPPLAALNGPYAGAEGSAIGMSGAASIDPNGTITSYQWSFGDGTTASGADVSHTYARHGSYAVQLVVTDNDALVDTIATTVTVANVAPVIGAFTVPATPQRIGSSVAISAPFTDAGTGNTHTATVQWGDGVTTSGLVSAVNGVGTISGTHTYSTAGLFTVTVTVTDDAAASAELSASSVIAYNPDAVLKGNGWLMPLDQQCTASSRCRVRERAQFEIEMRYGDRRTRPEGDMDLKVKGANFDFNGKATEWLVAAGATAYAQGTGKVNGRTGFAFLVSAVDGQEAGGGGIDRLRLKVWNVATGEVVYDNQRGAANTAVATETLGGGRLDIRYRDPRDGRGERADRDERGGRDDR